MKSGMFSLLELAARFKAFEANMKHAGEAILTEWAVLVRDKAQECFSALKGERGMTAVDFEQVALRRGVGPDIHSAASLSFAYLIGEYGWPASAAFLFGLMRK
jgi:hypothetical protein